MKPVGGLVLAGDDDRDMHRLQEFAERNHVPSEGLDVVIAEGVALGGQAGTSSRIENYPRLPARDRRLTHHDRITVHPPGHT